MSAAGLAGKLHDCIHKIGIQHQETMQYQRQMEALIAGDADAAALESVLDRLIEHSHTCFEFEESLMKVTGYGPAGDHLQFHHMFMRRLSGYRGRLRTGQHAATELISLMGVWVSGHIGEQDRELIEAMRQLAQRAA